MLNNKKKIQYILTKELNSWQVAELIAIDWQVTIQIKLKNIVVFMDLWEFKDKQLILEAISREQWKYIKVNTVTNYA